jgi:hypothetical protein
MSICTDVTSEDSALRDANSHIIPHTSSCAANSHIIPHISWCAANSHIIPDTSCSLLPNIPLRPCFQASRVQCLQLGWRTRFQTHATLSDTRNNWRTIVKMRFGRGISQRLAAGSSCLGWYKCSVRWNSSLKVGPRAADNCLAASSSEVPRRLWNMKVHYLVHENHPLVVTLSQINLVHTFLLVSSRYILILCWKGPSSSPYEVTEFFKCT